MAMQQPKHTSEHVHYPASDGQPMGETDTHWLATAELAYSLRHRYRDQPNVYVASDNFLYYEEGNPRATLSPDVYVVFGARKRLRRTYKVWEEEGRCPDVVFEISSRETWIEDTGNKMAVCARLGVREYFLFDPERDYLDPPLQGYRLKGSRYVPLAPLPSGSLNSEVLGLTLVAVEGQLSLSDTETGERLLGPGEAQAKLSATDAKLSAAQTEVTRLRADLERRASDS